jgi:hypothetical protein
VDDHLRATQDVHGEQGIDPATTQRERGHDHADEDNRPPFFFLGASLSFSFLSLMPVP